MIQECAYHDIDELKKFHKKYNIKNCFKDNVFSPAVAYNFFSNLAYESEDIGRCISLIPNVIAATLLEKYDKEKYSPYIHKIKEGDFVAAVCNNEASNHGSNLNAMASFIHYNDDGSCEVSIDKKMITNVGASDLLFICVSVKNKAESSFAVLLFEGQEVHQYSLSDKLHGLSSCPTGSVRAELTCYKDIRFISKGAKSFLMMRHMYNMERFVLGCIMAGILRKIVHYALEEQDLDMVGKFNNQYLQDKVIVLFSLYLKLESLLKNCIHYMESGKTIEPLLSIIKLSCINDVHQAIMILKEIYGGKSYFKDHITSRLLRDHEAIYNLGGTSELMKQTLFNDLKNRKTRSMYV